MTERTRVIVIDDHPVVAMGLRHADQQVEVAAAVGSVEELLLMPPVEADVILLDLQLGSGGQVCGTEAIRLLLDNGLGPVVIYTSVAEDMILVACVAAGATGAVTKQASPQVLGDVVRMAAKGLTWFDPAVAGALQRLKTGRHAGALSVQQAAALRLRGQGLTQRAIAERIGVSDAEIVNKYLRSAVEKLTDPNDQPETTGRHPGAGIDDLAQRSGLASGLVRHVDVDPRRPDRPGKR